MELKELEKVVTKLGNTPNDMEIEYSLRGYFTDDLSENKYCYGDILYADTSLEVILDIVNDLKLQKKHFSGMYRCDLYLTKDGMYYLCKDECFSIW